MSRLDISYVVPLRRRSDDTGLEELTRYLKWLARRVEVIVADGSAPDLYAEHHELWKEFTVHFPVIRPPGTNGKVTGVHAGVGAAAQECVVVADDDVRYDDSALESVAAALASADLVRPQNFFRPVPWHAAWDTSRTLLNRCFGSDSPGTLAVRRSFFIAMGGYDGGVLYENLELIRTVEAGGGRVANRPDLYVKRLPPTARRFWEQRPRQAYDDFAQPAKLTLFLVGLPAMYSMRRRAGAVTATVAALWAVAMAERGRRRWGGTLVFPPSTSWWAPVWVLERSVAVWLALGYRLAGGAPYAEDRFRVAAHSITELRRGAHPVTAVTEGGGAGAAAAAQGYD